MRSTLRFVLPYYLRKPTDTRPQAAPRPSCDARRPSIARSSLPRRSSINRPSSILPKPRPSKLARSSIIADKPAQPRHLASGALIQAEDEIKSGWAGLTDKEIDERVRIMPPRLNCLEF